MDPNRYRAPHAGCVVAVGQGKGRYHAFIPAPIPRALDLGVDLVLALSDADRALGTLQGLGGLLPNPHLLIRPYMRREAVASNRIEGTESTLGEVFSAEAQLELIPKNPDLREVLNYVRALELGLERLNELPVSNRLMREMHAELLRDVRGQERTPGEFRRSPNWIGGRGLNDAIFVPPPPDQMNGALDDLERYLHEDVPLPVLVRCALIHYQFETIHPFLDGNGRLGRLLIVFFLIQRRVLPAPLLYISSYLEEFRREYYERLQAVRERAEIQEWLQFFLTAVAVQAEDAVVRAEHLHDLREGYRLQLARSRSRAVEVVDLLFVNPF